MMVNEGQIFDTLSSLPNYVEVEDSGDVRAIFTSLCKYFDRGNPDDDILIHSLTLKLIYTIAQYAPSDKLTHNPKNNNHKVIERAVDYINRNLTADLSLEALSDLFNYTPIYFHKLFKASTGKTLHEYVEEQRIKRSIELMLSTEMTLTQIAYECGFSSQSYFSYAFKKKMAYPPREYTKNIFMKYEK
jgi:AraC-like DNA-binding protein